MGKYIKHCFIISLIKIDLSSVVRSKGLPMIIINNNNNNNNINNNNNYYCEKETKAYITEIKKLKSLKKQLTESTIT